MTDRHKRASVIILATVAGMIDALAYIRLGHVFAANMTGNLVLLFLAVALGHHRSVDHSMAALLGFILGAALGAGVAQNGPPHLVRRRLLAAEFILLAGFATVLLKTPALGVSSIDWLVIIAAAAMGVQSAFAHFLDIAGATTTVVTSTLTQILMDVVRLTKPPGNRPPSPANPIARLLVFLAYGIGALISGLLRTRLVPLGMLPVLGMLGVWPLATKSHPDTPKVAQQ